MGHFCPNGAEWFTFLYLVQNKFIKGNEGGILKFQYNTHWAKIYAVSINTGKIIKKN